MRIGFPDRHKAFKRIINRKPFFNTVIDIGASDGRWSFQLMDYFPDSYYFLIEAQPVHNKNLEISCKKRKNLDYILAAAGEFCGEIFFDASDPFGGQASYIPYDSNHIRMPATTIDNVVKSRELKGPFLIKFDTHGFEVPILKGASKTLENTEIIIMECYNFKIAPDSLLFFEMCQYLKNLGFRCIDMFDPMLRPYDNSFWQIDLVFIKSDRPEFFYSAYK